MLDVVRRYWGYESLRPLQREAITAGVERRDSLVVLPTGGGKSLCYQVPPVLANRTDVVVSPLIALMKDQVDGLRECGYPAAALNSGMTSDERLAAQRSILTGQARLIFAAPERLLTDSMIRTLQQASVQSFAIDEAHCISHWGHDFRPEYRRLAELRTHFPGASLHAFTATATPRVRSDIAAQLRLRDPAVLVGTFDRANLVYRVAPLVDVYSQTVDVLRRHAGQAAIVYCLSRRDTEALAEHLRASHIKAEHYHAGMEAAERRRTQDAFSEEKIDVIVATVAFGMGIDRSDVRCVVHAAMPKSVEHYQQETGRAGRDGLEAECVLLYSAADALRWESLMERNLAEEKVTPEVHAAMLELLAQMRRFAATPRCRHAALSQYFGQALGKANCGACDVCLNEVEGVEDATVAAQKILSCVARVKERFGVGHVADVLLGAGTARIRELGHDKLSTFGLLKGESKKSIASKIYQLLDQGVLSRTGDEYPILTLNAASWEVMRGQRSVGLVAPKRGSVARTKTDVESWDGVDRDLFEDLRILRREIAEERGVPPFVIFSDATLRDLARHKPTAPERMNGIYGVGERKRNDLGPAFTRRIAAYCAARAAATDVPAAPAADERRARRSAARQRAFQLFEKGAGLDEVAEQVQRAASTVTEYLCEFIAERRPRDIERWISAAQYEKVRDAGIKLGLDSPRPKPVFDYYNGELPYDVIRVAIAHLAAGGA